MNKKASITNLLNFKSLTRTIFTLIVLLSFSVISNAQVGQANDTGIPISISSTHLLTSGPASVITKVFGTGTPDISGMSYSQGTQTLRLFRDGEEHTCLSPGSGFDTFGSGSYGYEAYTFIARSNECTVIDVTSFNIGLYAAIYSGSFNPSNIVENGVCHLGNSLSTSMSFNAIAGQTYVLVVNEINTGTGSGISYSINVNNVGGSTVPVSIWWTLAAFAIIGGVTVFYKRKVITA